MNSPKTTPQFRVSRRLRIDLSDWELADWPEQLEGTLKVSQSEYENGIQLSFDADFTEVARTIAKEAIETFLRDSDQSILSLTPKGIEIREGGTLSDPVLAVIPYDRLWLPAYEGRKKTEATLKAIEEQLSCWRKEAEETLAEIEEERDSD